MTDWEKLIPWAVGLSHRYKPTGMLTAEDYEVIAELALWRASERYEGTHGASFKTYAYRFVCGDILHAIRDSSGVPGWAYEKGERLRVDQFDEVEEDSLAFLADEFDTEAEALERVCPTKGLPTHLPPSHCRRGHPLEGDNLLGYGTQYHCRQCRIDWMAKRRRAAGVPHRNGPNCIHGHPLSGDNLVIMNGHRRCRECARRRTREWKRKKTANDAARTC